MTPGVLIGAYERDNFGDILFLEQTREFLGGVPSLARSAFRGDMKYLIGEDIEDYRADFAGAPVPFVWVVGGEAGGTSVKEARHMSESLVATGASAERTESSLPSYASPYIPRPSRYEALRGATYVINSVGVSGIGSLVGRRRIETLGALKEATFLSVREMDSSTQLKRLGIEHRLAPDLVQTIAHTYAPKIADIGDVALVQAKSRSIEAVGVRAFTELLLRSTELSRYQIRLFSAGEAQGHDSTPLLHAVAEEALNFPGRRTIEVSEARTPREKVDEIASCGLWLGTSLHGYIISTAFSRPRVGLLYEKLSRYASTWEIPYPTAVAFADIDDAIAASRALHKSTDGEQMASSLALMASSNAEVAREQVLNSDGMRSRLERERLASGSRVRWNLRQSYVTGSVLEHSGQIIRRGARRIKSFRRARSV